MPRVLYLVQEYPQVSETYIRTEIARVKRRYDVSIVSFGRADLPYPDHEPYELLKERNAQALTELARRHRPDIVHGHYLSMVPALGFVAREAGTHFTVRSHSFDVLSKRFVDNPNVVRAINDATCRGVLCFPFAADTLIRAGIHAGKVHPCWPVADIAKFRNRAPNGDDIMNVGATLPKKAMNLFVDLAAMAATMRFNLYMLGYGSSDIEAHARATGSPVNIMKPRHPDAMPAEYKRHRWMVYTASKAINNVGWPLSVAEAQASGVGVLVQNIRPDLADYVGSGGYVFDTLDEARRIISGPFPEEKREAAFAHAEKSDIDQHIGQLFDLWS